MSEALLSIHVEALPEGGFLATSEDVPSLLAQGRTVAETHQIAQAVARKLVASCIEHDDPLPSALSTTSPLEVEACPSPSPDGRFRRLRRQRSAAQAPPRGLRLPDNHSHQGGESQSSPNDARLASASERSTPSLVIDFAERHGSAALGAYRSRRGSTTSSLGPCPK